MRIVDGELVASFAPHRNGREWCGAIYVMHIGRGPEAILHCVHLHRSIGEALDCAERELAWSRRIVDLANHYRDIAS